MACSPVIAITGGPDSESRYRYLYQEVEDFSMFDPVTKFNGRIDKLSRLPALLREAFGVATAGAPGPVHLEMRGSHGQVIEEEGDLDLIFEEQYEQYPAFRPEPEMEWIREAAAALTKAQRPVIVAGGGVTSSQAQQEVVQLAEMLSIPVATSLNGKGTISDDHPLSVGVAGTYSRSCANRAVAEADLVFFIGSHTGSQVTNNWKIPRAGTPVIQMDISPADLGRNYPNVVSLLGDAKVTLRRLIDALKPMEPRTGWVRWVQQLVSEWRNEVAALRDSNAVPMRPERICKEITEFLPSNGVVVSDTGHSGIWTGAMIELKKPGQRYSRCAGYLDWTFLASLGVKCDLHNRPASRITGNADLYS